MNHYKLLLSLALVLITVHSFAQVLYPENDPITSYNTGMYYQAGPGANNSSYNWTYPYGTKLTIHYNIDRNFELMTIDKDGQALVFRQWLSNVGWRPWQKIVSEDENGIVGPIRARQTIAVDKEGSYRVALNGVSDGYIKGRNDAVEDKFLINSNGNSYLNGGNVGIGTITPATQLDVQGTTRISNAGDDAVLLDLASERGWQFRQKGTGSGTNLELYNYSGLNKNFLITTDGSVGIGTTSPDAKLTVKGSIHTEEVKVDLNVPAPDYVFEKDYNLPSLEDIQNYIGQHKHLPGVPSAKVLEENGINVGAMNMVLLKKVEELTLHLIEQNKLIAQLKEERTVRNDALEKKVEDLKMYLIQQQKEINTQKSGCLKTSYRKQSDVKEK